MSRYTPKMLCTTHIYPFVIPEEYLKHIALAIVQDVHILLAGFGFGQYTYIIPK
jgi:hypothetical protein